MSTSPLSWRSGLVVGRSRLLTAAAIGCAILLLLALGMYLYDRGRRDLIASGVRIDGVNVGGMREAAALTKLQSQLAQSLNRPVTVRASSLGWTLGAQEAALKIDAQGMVAQAVRASREGSIFSRTVRGLFGGSVNRNIPLLVTYSHAAVRALTAKVRSAVNRPPRNATVQPSPAGLTELPAQDGLKVDSSRLGGRIDRALTGAAPSRTVTVPVFRSKPAVGTGQLAAKYPAYIIIDRAAFKLRFYQHLKLASTYEIAVGMEGLETPPGVHKIEWKQVDPPWYVPNKAWAGKLAGTVVPPGPADPLKARFMSFDAGAGIHGIDPSEYETIGHDASHGCVRMRIPDVIALYSRTPVGTPVYIA
jgi:lipoprotein-anchoring transpeptidase ErfK/SrfK